MIRSSRPGTWPGKPISRRSRQSARPLREAWPTRHATRQIAWHVIDHMWEIEDRGQAGLPARLGA